LPTARQSAVHPLLHGSPVVVQLSGPASQVSPMSRVPSPQQPWQPLTSLPPHFDGSVGGQSATLLHCAPVWVQWGPSVPTVVLVVDVVGTIDVDVLVDVVVMVDDVVVAGGGRLVVVGIVVGVVELLVDVVDTTTTVDDVVVVATVELVVVVTRVDVVVAGGGGPRSSTTSSASWSNCNGVSSWKGPGVATAGAAARLRRRSFAVCAAAALIDEIVLSS
jgi:hypothetical protein